VPNCVPHGGCPVCCYLGDTKEKIIANHIAVNANGEPTQQNGISLQLDVGDPIQFQVLNSDNVAEKTIATIENNPNYPSTYTVSAKIDFKNKIDSVAFNGFSFEVTKSGFDNLKRGS